MKEATRIDLSATTEHEDWSKKVRDLRNDLVYGKKLDVTRSEALEAYRAVKAAITLLEPK